MTIVKKTILITGTSSGIGKAFVKLAPLYLKDYRIIALTRAKSSPDPSDLHETIQVNITDTKQLSGIVKNIVEKYGAIDVLVNNAGNGLRGSIEDSSTDEIKEQLSINVWPVVELSRLVIPSMRRNRSGHIINVSSLAATIEYPTIGYYGATKAFIAQITRVMDLELRPWNIRTSLVIPGAVKTNFGRSMKNVRLYRNSEYAQLYEQWGEKFASLFRKPTTSDQAALKIVQLIRKPRSILFFRTKDKIFYLLRQVFGYKVFNKLFLNKHMRG